MVAEPRNAPVVRENGDVGETRLVLAKSELGSEKPCASGCIDHCTNPDSLWRGSSSGEFDRGEIRRGLESENAVFFPDVHTDLAGTVDQNLIELLTADLVGHRLIHFPDIGEVDAAPAYTIVGVEARAPLFRKLRLFDLAGHAEGSEVIVRSR